MDAAPPPTDAPHLGRRTYVVDRGFQFKYTMLLVVAGALIAGLFGSMMFVAHAEARRGFDRSLERFGASVPPELHAELAQIDTTLIWLMMGITLLMGVALGLFGLLVTHRVAGPVQVMSHYMGVLAAGRYPMMRPLRKNDELKSFFERFQQAVESLRTREEEEARVLANALERLAPASTAPGGKETLDALKAIYERKRDATDRVQVNKA